MHRSSQQSSSGGVRCKRRYVAILGAYLELLADSVSKLHFLANECQKGPLTLSN